MEKNTPINVSKAIENMLKTGRLITSSGLDLQQVFFCLAVLAPSCSYLYIDAHFLCRCDAISGIVNLGDCKQIQGGLNLWIKIVISYF